MAARLHSQEVVVQCVILRLAFTVNTGNFLTSMCNTQCFSVTSVFVSLLVAKFVCKQVSC